MDHYRISTMLTILTTAGISLFVFFSDHKRRVTQLYLLYDLTIFLWAMCWYQMMTAKDFHSSMFFCHLLHMPSVFIPSFFFLFIGALVGKENELLYKRLAFLFLCGSLFFWTICWSEAFIPTRRSPQYPYFFFPGPLYLICALYYLVVISVSFGFLFHSYRHADTQTKTQIAHCSGAYALGYLGGATIFLRIYEIPMPVYFLYCISLGHAWLMYAILRHQLLDVRIFVRRTGLLVSIYAGLLIALNPLLDYLQQIANLGSTGSLHVQIIFAGIVLSIGPFLYAYIVRRSAYFHKDTIAGLTHELKTPLAAIQSALEILELERSGGSPRDQTYLDMIKANTTRLQTYTDALMSALVTDPSRYKIDRRPVDLNTLCKTVVDQIRPLAEAKLIALVFQGLEPSADVQLDAEKISQALTNIVSNAVKFTDGGTINIVLRKHETEVHVIIQDTGPGLSKDELPHIFDRFFQGRQGRTKRGSGIGLTIAKTWIEAHGGKIWAESGGEGKGTTMTFTLPLN